ncbi:MAG: chromosome partitioning protein ParA [Synechococcaceae cyanobacterium SM2_3_1]|nr:chromosome partitioning protein ParA [Synechococcaceae cyanobacterium SM2_3_1]
MESEKSSSILIITGMHRSGTSLTASILQSAGLHIGRKLMGANKTNPKGHFENLDFLNLHKAILRSQGITDKGWTLQERILVNEQYIDQAQQIVEQNSISGIWGWKEPRTTLFLDFWSNFLPEAKFLLIYRSPWEVIDSLYRRREDTPFPEEPELPAKLWLHYNQKLIDFCNHFSHRCILVNVCAAVEHSHEYIQAINQKFGVTLSSPAQDIYDPELFHTHDPDGYRASLTNQYFPEVIEMYQELEARAWQPSEVVDLSWRDRIKANPYANWAFRDWVDLRGAEARNQQLQNDMKKANSQLSKMQSEVIELKSEAHQAQESFKKVESQHKQAQAELEEAQNKQQQLSKELEQSQVQIKQFQAQLEQSQQQEQKLQQELEESKGRIQQTDETLGEFQLQLQQSKAELKHNQNLLTQAHESIDSQKAELKQLQTQLSKIQNLHDQSQTELQKSQTECARVQADLDQEKIDHARNRSELQQLQLETKQHYTQFHQVQEELEQSQTTLQETQEVFRRISGSASQS